MDPQVQAAFRQLATSGGAVITALGFHERGVDWVSLLSAIFTIGSFLFSLYSNRPKALVENAAQSGKVTEITLTSQAMADSITSNKVVGPTGITNSKEAA